MNPFRWLVAALTRRYSERTLARVVVVLAVLFVGTQLLLFWYFGSVGLSLNELSHGSDERVVVLDEEDEATFDRHYREDLEVGWCLYGGVNATHVRIDDVVPAEPMAQESDRIEFTCVPETADRVASVEPPNLIGVAHSHPSRNRSEISRLDAVTWGRISPVVEVKGIYTETEGVQFFSLRSLVDPLEKDVRAN